jgi:hypothetical protein
MVLISQGKSWTLACAPHDLDIGRSQSRLVSQPGPSPPAMDATLQFFHIRGNIGKTHKKVNKNMRRRFLGWSMLAAIGCLAIPSAHADVVVISGSGNWGSNALTTPESAPGDSFSFTFDISSPYSGTPYDGGVYTTDATNFSYELNNTPVAVTLTGVVFYPSSINGLFDLDFSDSNALNAFGPDIGSTKTITLIDTPANFAISDPTTGPNGVGSGSVSVSSTVPEPISVTLLGTGLLGLLAVRRNAKLR